MTSRREWFTAAELAGLPELPGTERGVQLRAARDGWASRARKGRGGGSEYFTGALPQAAREALAQRDQQQGESGLASLAAMPEWKRVRAMARSQVLDLCEARIADWGLSRSKGILLFEKLYNSGEIGVSDEIRNQVPTIDQRTWYRWNERRAKSGIAGLADNYGTRKGTGVIDASPELRELLVGLISKNPNIRPVRIVEFVRATRTELAQALSTQKVERWLHAWKSDNEQLWTSLTNPDRFKSVFKPAFGKADANIERLNQLWEMDSTPADVMLTDGRHAVLGVIDIYSRRAKLLVSKTSKASAVAALARRAILSWGVPEKVRTDNGADYTSQRLTTALLSLSIDQHLCAPFKSEEKPFIERFFRTFSGGLLELKPGFIGHNVAERKAIESRRSFSQRLMERDAVVEVSMSSSDLQKFCDEWCTAVYERAEHGGLGSRTPFDVARAWTHPVRRIEDVKALDLLLEDGGERTVQKSGIRIEGAYFIHADLAPHIGARVFVRFDPNDMGRIRVWNDAGFICEAECPERTGVSREEVGAVAQARQKAAVREARATVRAAGKIIPEDVAEAILAKKREEAAQVSAMPHQGEAYTTPMLAAAGDAVRGFESVRQAPRPVARDTEAEARGTQVVAKLNDQLRRRQTESSVDLDLSRKTVEEFKALRTKEGAEGLTNEERDRKRVLTTLPEVAGFLRRERAPVTTSRPAAVLRHAFPR